jgi:hypothetical protein
MYAVLRPDMSRWALNHTVARESLLQPGLRDPPLYQEWMSYLSNTSKRGCRPPQTTPALRHTTEKDCPWCFALLWAFFSTRTLDLSNEPT